MPEMVTVSLLHAVSYRDSKAAETIRYPRGLVEMPLAHAKAMGVTHRIRSVKSDPATGKTTVTALPFESAFDDRLAESLTAAGFATLADLRKATQSELMAVEGVGPAAYERIRSATGGTE